MHPNTFILSLGALVSVTISTEVKDNDPRCPEDDYYNAMMETKNRHAAATDFAKWLGGTITDPSEIPKYLKDCGGDKEEDRVSRVSAACSCIATSTVSATSSTQAPVSSTSSSTSVVTTLSQPSSHPPSTTTGSTGIRSSEPSSSQILSPNTPSSQSVPLSSSGSTSPLISTGHISSSSTVPHSSTSSSQLTISSSATRTHSTTGPSNTDHTQTGTETTRSRITDTHTTDTQTRTTLSSLSSGASTATSTVNKQTVTQTTLSTVTAPGSSITDVAPSQASTTSFTTSTIYTESIYTMTSCAPGKMDCPAASTILVTSTIAISTTICPVAETPRPNPPQQETTTQWKTSTIYSTSTYTLTRCPPGATNCPVGNLPITTVIPVSTSTQTGSPNENQGKPNVPSTTFTMVTVPTTIHTIMNGASAQILTVVPVTSTLVINNPNSAQTASSIADANSHAGNAQSPSPSSSGVTSKPMTPASNNPITGSTSSRPPVVTASAPGLVGSDGMRVAFFVFVVAALL